MRVSTSWLLGLSLVIAACSNSSPSSVGVSLTAVTDAGRACPNGGVIISTGLDVNGDGELAASEVTATHTVCSGINGSNGSNGGTGHSSLVFTTSLPTGNSHCPYGGTEIDTGLDNGDGGGTADDGILQAGEVDSTQYVCSVETSASGGHNSLVSTTELSSGDRNCPAGGTEIDSGFDNGSGGGTADDGVLQSGEITATQYVCDGSSGNASHDSLVKTTVLDVGDSHCAEGGTQIDSGVDNGAGHGTADDGILQNGEITSTQYVCSGVASPTELVTTTAVAVGDSTCPFGGIVIATGLDNGAGGGTAGDGTLQSGEVTSSNYVCASAPSSLVVTTTLATGSANCPDGGTELDTGLDNGANGGTAGDGILQAGEITASQFICSGPSAPPATFTIDTSGGSGSTGPGGISGTFDLEINQGSNGGAVSILGEGVADASFTVPSLALDFGSNPLFVVSTTPALNAYPNTDLGIASQDAYFQVVGDDSIYANQAGIANQVTGVNIASGATLTLADNNNGEAYVYIPGDFHSAGTLTTRTNSPATGIELYVTNYLGDSSSAIDTSGSGDGVAGGHFTMAANGGLVNHGAITTFGSDGSGSGGIGGDVSITAEFSAGLFNAGIIDSHGGGAGGTALYGGNGGSITLVANGCNVNNAGSLITSGGSGHQGNGGGDGGSVYFTTPVEGSIFNSGSINTRGGAAGVHNNGGQGGSTNFNTTYNGDVVNSGSIDTSGGDVALTNVDGGACGNAGNVNAYVQNGGGILSTLPATGSIRFSGTLTLHGGNGLTGGGGGQVTAQIVPDSNSPPKQEIAFLGYTDVAINGGASAQGNGGDAQGFTMSQDNPSPSGGPAGGVINEANVSAVGGDGSFGGNGGTIVMLTQQSTNFSDTFETVTNSGKLDVHGGATSTDFSHGSVAGNVTMSGIQGVHNAGVINANGGATSGENSIGGSAGTISFTTLYNFRDNSGALTCSGGNAVDGNGGAGGTISFAMGFASPIHNTGPLTANGGTGSNNGGTGGSVELFGPQNGDQVNNSATITCDGGASQNGGGAGGSIELDSFDENTANTGQLLVDGGQGPIPGSAGTIFVE